MPLSIVRSDLVKNLHGGIYRSLAKILERSFGNIFNEGVMIAGRGGHGPFVVHAKVSVIVGDEAARRAFWSTKGASGLLCCLVCWNVCSIDEAEDNIVASDGTGTLVGIRCRFDQCRLRTDRSLFAQADELARTNGVVNNAAFSKLEKACGIAYRRDAVLWDAHVRGDFLPVSIA